MIKKILKLPYFLLKYFFSNKYEKTYFKHKVLYLIGNLINLEEIFFTDPLKESVLEDVDLQKLKEIAGSEITFSLDRKFTLKNLLKLVKDIEGDFIEMGVYKGASAYLMCSFIMKNNLQKKVYLIDSFEGLPSPTREDGSYWKKGDLKATQLYPQLEEYESIIRIYKGWIPEVFSQIPKDIKISFAHIDVDLYKPTFESIKFVWGKLNRGGVILFDDYYFKTCPGARRAINEFFNENEIVILPTGQSFVIKR